MVFQLCENATGGEFVRIKGHRRPRPPNQHMANDTKVADRHHVM